MVQGAIMPTCDLHGFSLLEMAIVLLIMAVLMGGGAAIFAASLQQRQSDETKAKLAIVQAALLDYRRAYNRIPCPGDVTQDPNAVANNYFGVEAALIDKNPASPTYLQVLGCNYSDVTQSPRATFYDGGNVYAGEVPTKTLQLPDEYGFDGWGRRLMYVVDQRLAVTDGFSKVAVTDTTTRITVNSTMAAPAPQKTNLAAYLLVSFGQNGHGAYPRGAGNARVNVGSVNTDELTNCHCNSDGTSAAFGSTFVQQLPSQSPGNYLNSFDDIVVYSTRAQLRALTE